MRSKLSRLWDSYKSSNTIKSSVWVTVGTISQQVLRFASNLILTRLLVPEYFGLMAIVWAFIGFFEMISDVGLVPSIINTQRHNDKNFLRTAWTVQVIRSACIAALVALFAFPLSMLYEDNRLFGITLCVSLTMLVGGFRSIAFITEQKYLRQRNLVIIDIVSDLVAMAIMVILAFYTGSYWSLVAGAVTGGIFKTLLSYLVLSGHHSIFFWEREAISEIFNFGKWIFIASILGYLASRTEPFVLKTKINFEMLGFYTIAVTLAGAWGVIADRLAMKIIHPKFSQMIGDDKSNLEQFKPIRNKFVYTFIAVPVIIACFGDRIISWLYDDRYAPAGWMLQILALGRVGYVLLSSIQPIVMASGKSIILMMQKIFNLVLILLIIPIGLLFENEAVIIILYALLPLGFHISMTIQLKFYGWNSVTQDIIIICICVFVAVLTWYIAGSSISDIFASIRFPIE